MLKWGVSALRWSLALLAIRCSAAEFLSSNYANISFNASRTWEVIADTRVQTYTTGLESARAGARVYRDFPYRLRGIAGAYQAYVPGSGPQTGPRTRIFGGANWQVLDLSALSVSSRTLVERFLYPATAGDFTRYRSRAEFEFGNSVEPLAIAEVFADRQGWRQMQLTLGLRWKFGPSIHVTAAYAHSWKAARVGPAEEKLVIQVFLGVFVRGQGQQ